MMEASALVLYDSCFGINIQCFFLKSHKPINSFLEIFKSFRGRVQIQRSSFSTMKKHFRIKLRQKMGNKRVLFKAVQKDFVVCQKAKLEKLQTREGEKNEVMIKLRKQ